MSMKVTATGGGDLAPDPGERARASAAWRVAHTAAELSAALGLVRLRATRLEERLRAAAERGVPRHEAEAMTGYGLDGTDVRAMIDRAYAREGG